MAPKAPRKTPDTTRSDLRRQAEERLQATRREVAAMPLSDVQRLVQELQLHQIELDMQMDELSRTQLELETARDRYAELYDFAPSGYLTLDIRGDIIEANLRACRLLGVNRKDVVRQSMAQFILPDDAEVFQRNWQDALRMGAEQGCQFRLRDRDGVVRWIHGESLALRDEEGMVTGWRMVLQDVSAQKLAERALGAQRSQLNGIISSAMDAIITVGEDQRIIVFNAAAESMFRCPASEAIGQALGKFIPERYREAHARHVREFGGASVASRRMGTRGLVRGLRSDGEEFPIDASISRIVVEGKVFCSVILRDVTERQQAQEILEASESFTRAILDDVPAQICVLNGEGVILRTNDAWETFSRAQAVSGFAVGEVGQNYVNECRRSIAEEEGESMAISRSIDAVLAGTQPSLSAELSWPLPEGTHWFLLRMVPLKGVGGAVLSLVDISERVRMQQDLEQHAVALREHKEQLELLSGRLIDAQEQERQRIARDLHDDISQRLAAIVLDLTAAELHPRIPARELKQALGAIRGHLEQVSDDIHKLAYQLHPSLLQHAGLTVAMEDHIQQVSKRTGIPVALQARRVPEALGLDQATCLFRVMQESLHNVVKHAQATGVTVRLSGSSKGVGVSVIDNGKGFDVSDKSAHQKGLGLVSMQERLRSLKGFLRIHSRPADGTKVCAWIPFKEEA